MFNIQKLKDSWYFKELILNKWETLFLEWSYDENIYFIEKWELVVSKYTDKHKSDQKILAFLVKNDVFWEASLVWKSKKEVNIYANKKTYLLAINGQEWLKSFFSHNNENALDLLKYIIFLSNKRLSESNYLITATYKITKEILNFKEINYREIFKLIDDIKDILWVEHIMYYENNPVITNYLVLKYDTRKKWKLLNEIIELTDDKFEALNLPINTFNIYIQKLTIWIIDIWYLIFLKKNKKFNDTDRKVLSIASTSIAGVVKQKQLLDEEKNKKSLEY